MIIEAMDELGLLGWLPNRRWSVRVRRPETSRDRTNEIELRSASRAIDPVRGVLAGAVALTATAAAVQLGTNVRLRSRGLLAAIVTSAGLLAAAMLVSFGRRATR